MRVCILGCSGFIGSHLVERLLDDGRHDVTGVDRVSAKIAHLLDAPRLEFHEVDASREDALRGFVRESDVVVHLAAICNPALYNTEPLAVIDASFTHALPTVRLCREYGTRLVFFSTCEVYGKTVAGFAPAGSAFREDPANYVMKEDESHFVTGPVSMQRWTYACAKQLAERVIYAEGRSNGLDFSIVRPFNFVGPRMDFLPGIDGEGIPRVVPLFMQALLDGQPLRLVDGGRNLRSFIYVADAVDACVRVIERPAECRGEIINVGNPRNETTMEGLARLMIELFAEKTGIRRPGPVEVSSREFYGEGYDDCDRRVPDVSKAERLLGWRPSVPLRETVSLTVDYYLERHGSRLR